MGCEITALAMLINYTVKAELDVLAAEMPRAENPYEGFRGDPASTNYGWTIFPPALIEMTEKYLGSAVDMSGCEPDDLKEKLAEGKPVMVWIRGLGWPVHALCLTGYDQDGFYYNDPATGEKDVFIEYEEFYFIWSDPIIDNYLRITFSPKIAMSY